jgi:RHS repeat-associated protein
MKRKSRQYHEKRLSIQWLWLIQKRVYAIRWTMFLLFIVQLQGLSGQTPAAPSALTATIVSSTQVNLAWTDNSTNETGFKIERKTGSGSYSQIATTGDNITTYSNTGLTAGNSYTYRVRANRNSSNSSYSNTAAVTMPYETSITTQPTSVTQCGGTTATFSVSAAGTSLTFQWRKGGTNISGATSSSYTMNSITTSNAGSFDVVVTGLAGSVTSTAATLTVNTLPVITTQPASLTQNTGTNATFSVTATGTGLTYQWRKEGTNISGATSASYTKNAIASVDAGSYDVVISVTCGTVTSSTATLMVQSGTTRDAYSLINAGSADANQGLNMGDNEFGSFDNGDWARYNNVNFSTAAISVGITLGVPADYAGQQIQLRLDAPTGTIIGTLTTSSTGSDWDTHAYVEQTTTITGATGVHNVYLVGVGAYGVADVENFKFYHSTAPVITTQPTNITQCTSTNASFSVSATGTSLTYQWRKGGTNISGATSSSYTMNSITTSNAGSFNVVVTGTGGSVTSTAATLTVNTAPAITTQPVSLAQNTGTNATFSVAATGTSLTYQWRKGGINISGATSSSYTISSVASGDAGDYTVVVSGACGSPVTSSTATLTVSCTNPVITTQPVSLTQNTGTNATFSVTATGTGLTYQWRKGGTNISGATSASYTKNAIVSGDAGSYDVVITGTCGAVTSSAATLTITGTTPTAPTGLTFTTNSSTQINLSWTDNANNETGFYIERKKTGEGSFTQIGSVGANVTTYYSNSLLPNTIYTYQVRAYNTSGTSAYTGTVTATTPSPTGAQPTASVAQYNGNITSIRWKTYGGSDVEMNTLKEYDYYYDGLNRLKGSQYQNLDNAGYNYVYNEDNITYDLNGNIQALKRNGDLNGMASLIDNLTYIYSGNQLKTVTDAADKTTGFIDNNITGDDYVYDENGNMTQDKNKNLNIKYNLLNLPVKISNGSDSIVYTYDAGGAKLRKKVYRSGVLNTMVDYAGETEFYNSQLKYIHTEEGLVEYNTFTSSFTYEYFLKDHLGNTRVVVSADGSGNPVIGQATDYYPFGMAYLNVPNNGNAGSDNKYLYNNKELQDENLAGVALNLYDYGARFYDAQIGRWNSIDPAIEDNHYNYTPYAYVYNNPIAYIDPDGLDTIRLQEVVITAYRTKENYDGAAVAAFSLLNSGNYIRGSYPEYSDVRPVVMDPTLHVTHYDCTGWVSYVLNKKATPVYKAITGRNSKWGIGRVVDLADYCRTHGGIRTTNPQVGDIAIWSGHAEFVVNADGNSFTTNGSSGHDGQAAVPHSNNKTFTGASDPHLKSWGTFVGFWTPNDSGSN